MAFSSLDLDLIDLNCTSIDQEDLRHLGPRDVGVGVALPPPPWRLYISGLVGRLVPAHNTNDKECGAANEGDGRIKQRCRHLHVD